MGAYLHDSCHSKGRRMVISRVAPLSVAKIAGVIYAILGLVFGAIVSLVSLAGLFAQGNFGDQPQFLAALFGVGSIIVLPIFYGCMGFVMSLIGAALYNLVAGVVGGVAIETQ
jgi:hypothetical protein